MSFLCHTFWVMTLTTPSFPTWNSGKFGASHSTTVCVPCPCVTDARLWNEMNKHIGGLFCSWAQQNLYKWSSKIWRAEIVSTCCKSYIDWNQLWHTILHAWQKRIYQQFEYIRRIPWFQNMVIKMFVQVLEICKWHCFASWQSLGETHLALEPRRWKAWTVIFPMANANTIFLLLASVGRLACPATSTRPFATQEKFESALEVLPFLLFSTSASVTLGSCVSYFPE